MTVLERHNVKVFGDGNVDMIFAHGYGCDQNMWRLLTPTFAQRYRIILFDLCGSGGSELSSYSREKYASLAGHASGVLAILEKVSRGPAVFVGHSVSAMIGIASRWSRNSDAGQRRSTGRAHS